MASAERVFAEADDSLAAARAAHLRHVNDDVITVLLASPRVLAGRPGYGPLATGHIQASVQAGVRASALITLIQPAI